MDELGLVGDAGEREWGWPNFPDACPPADAVPASGVVYRLVRHSPPEVDDFTPWILEYPQSKKMSSGQLARAWGISVYGLFDDAAKLKDGKDLREAVGLVPGLKRWRIARGTLVPAYGLMKATPKDGNSHYDWWRPKDVDPSAAFEVVEAA